MAFPSSAYLADATGQDRKTVLANLAKLREWGLIVDTGERKGTTGQIVVYRLVCGPDLFTEQSQNRDSPENGTLKNSAEIGTVERVPKTAAKSTVFGAKESQKRDTEPSETKRTKSESRAREEIEKPEEPKPTVGGLAARALIQAGVVHVNPTDPRLLKLLESGVTIDELRDAASEAVKAKKGTLAYVCGVVRGRREDANAAVVPPAKRQPTAGSHVVYVPEKRARGDPEATERASKAAIETIAKTLRIPTQP